MRHNDVYHITVAGVNPHDIASSLNEEGSPFEGDCTGTCNDIIVEDQIVGGNVEVWAGEHLTADQERYIESMENVVDVRHVWSFDRERDD